MKIEIRKIGCILVFIIFLGVFPLKAIDLNIMPSISYGQNKQNNEKNGLFLPYIDVYVPFTRSIDIGIGLGYASIGLDSNQLLGKFSIDSKSDAKSSIGVIPFSVNFKYAYDINNSVKLVYMMRAGLMYGEDKYYAEESGYSGDICESGSNCVKVDSARLIANNIIGLGIGLQYKDFVFSIHYDSLSFTNRYKSNYYEVSQNEGNDIRSELNSVARDINNRSAMISFRLSYLISYSSSK